MKLFYNGETYLEITEVYVFGYKDNYKWAGKFILVGTIISPNSYVSVTVGKFRVIF